MLIQIGFQPCIKFAPPVYAVVSTTEQAWQLACALEDSAFVKHWWLVGHNLAVLDVTPEAVKKYKG